MRGLSLGGGTRGEYIGRNGSLGRFLVVEIVRRSWGDARSLLRQGNNACFDDDRGNERWGSRRLWEEMEWELSRMGGRDLHDDEEERKEGEQGEGN